ncbi:uncharacterized protein LOC142994992 [Genypterus blacodes]|uniref:uncharacterized protein LOC142994992 n=1 Tax=Genypterus blacodes TaxID=154954 RepID=UPI003F760DAB
MAKVSAAEKQRLYRQRRDADPSSRAEYLAKRRQGYVNDILTQKRKKVGDLSKREKRAQRKVWRVNQARHRHLVRPVQAVLSSSGTASAAFMRKRVTSSPVTNSMLAAPKRLLDKALLHRAKSVHQVASLLRREHSTVQGVDLSGAMPQQPQTYDLTTEKTVIGNKPGGSSFPKRFLTQRPVLSVRSLQPPPRVGIRLPPAPLTSSVGAAIRLQTTGGQVTAHSEGNPSPQQAVHDAGGRGGLQEQIQSLESEVRNLGQAVKMLVEHQSRLEREQAQQTHIQKQILGTLQSLASKLGPCRNQQQHNKTPSPSASTSFSQDTFNYSQGRYTQCSQTQPSYNSMESLEYVEAFKVPGLSPTSMNGFPPCSSAESLTLTHTPPQSQPYATAYTQQHTQTLISSYTQPYVSTYSPSHSQSFRGSESKHPDFSGSLQDCSFSSQPALNATHMPQDQQVNVIKE